jgi:hypothetical protein
MKLTGEKPTTRIKTCPTANLTWTDPGSNLGLRGERPATNRLSHGTAIYRLDVRHFREIVLKFL